MACGPVWRIVAPALVVAAALTMASGTAVAAPSVQCGAVIAQDATLTDDLADCAEGIEVTGSGVTLDLAGHSITGTGVGVGVWVSGHDVTIKNGVVSGFGTGVATFTPRDAETPRTFHLKSLHVVENTLGVSMSGYSMSASGVSSIESSWIDRNTRYGLAFDRVRLLVTDSSIRQNGADGVRHFEAIAVYERNTISSNGGDGLHTWSPFGISLIDNELNGNTGSGFNFSSAYRDAYPYLEGNRADRNGQLGFWVVDAGGSREHFDGGGNSAKLNGDTRQCVVQEPIGVIVEGALGCARNPSAPNTTGASSMAVP